MVTYVDFKEFIISLCKNCGGEKSEDNADSASIVFSGVGGALPSYLREEEIQQCYDRAVTFESDGLELYTNNSYEIAVEADRMRFWGNDRSESLYDRENKITYDLGEYSDDYRIFLALKWIDANKTKGRETIPLPKDARFRRRLFDYGLGEKKITLQTILRLAFDGVTLKVKTDKGTSLQQLKEYKDSFFFQYMYCKNLSITEISDAEDLFHLKRRTRGRGNLQELDTPPLRLYDGELIDYYKMALSAKDPYIEYISYYHIIEYFFDDVYRKRLIKGIRGELTGPDFSYKSDKAIYELALYMNKNWKISEDAGRGNELDSLKFILEEYIDIYDLKKRINLLDTDGVDYLEKNEVPFCDGPKIQWKNNEGRIKSIADRIYQTRNSLIHSKAGKDKKGRAYKSYKIYHDEEFLQKEVPLVRGVAEQIIVKTSKLM